MPPFVWFFMGVIFLVVLLGMYAAEEKSYKDEYLFSRDGCDVYSFYDDGRKHYFVNCVTLGRAATTYDGDSNIITERK